MAKKQLEISTLVPCMVVLVTCQGVDGIPNVSTISEGGVLCNHPPMIGISVAKPHLSYRQIKETGEFVVNVPSEDLLWESDACGCVSGRKKDKFELIANLQGHHHIKSPYPKKSKFKFVSPLNSANAVLIYFNP